MIDMIEPKHKIKYEIQNIEKSVKCIKKDKIDKAIQKYKINKKIKKKARNIKIKTITDC